MSEDIVAKLVSGELKLREADDKASSRREAVDMRREAISRLTHTSLSKIGEYSYDPEIATRKNIENAIGAIQVPLGIAGPLKVNGEYAKGEFYIPLATTEGALVASVNRGCSVCILSGGVSTAVIQDEMTRAPVVRANSLAEAKKLVTALSMPELFGELKSAAAATTKHGELLRIDPYVVGRSVFLRFAFDTKDAMGSNMTTIATDAAMRLLETKFDIRLIADSGNMCTDKKPAAINIIEGRGRSTVAEIVVPRRIAVERLKATPEDLCEVNYRKNFLGSARAASLGFNAHVANVIAAMYIACGQDPAHVVEGSNAITSAEMDGEDLRFSVSFPSLPLGTVGGGTGLATQGECLGLLGVKGGGSPPGSHARKLAEIVAAASLAGELSLLGALASRDLANAHAKYGR